MSLLSVPFLQDLDELADTPPSQPVITHEKRALQPTSPPVVQPLHDPFATSEACIELQNCSVHPRGRAAPLVDDITMRVGKGDIFAILGPSGCGKSTLFSLLSRRLRKVKNWCVYANRFLIPENVVLVPQHDVFFPHDTPLRALSFIYQKTTKCTDDEANNKSMEILKLLGLSSAEKVNSKFGQVGHDSPFTGGERRLLAVARALMTEPDAILLDEPTTGLDAWTALDLVRKIKGVAVSSSTSFVFTVHQPSDALIAEFGTHILRLTPPLPKPEPALEKFSYPPRSTSHTFSDWLWILWLLLRRNATRMVVNPTGALLQTGVVMMMAFTLGLSFIQLPYDDPKYLSDVVGVSAAAVSATFTPLVFVATMFPQEKAHFMDENPLCDTPHLIADAISRVVVDTALAAVQTTFMLICCPMIGIVDIGDFWLTVWLQFCASSAFGFFLSTVARPHVSIGTLIPTIGFVSFAIGAGLMSPEKDGAGWIFHVAKWASFFKYGSAAMLMQELPRADGTCNSTPMANTTNGTTAAPVNCLNGEQMLSALELTGDDFIHSFAFQRMMLVVLTVVMRLISVFTVRHVVVKGAAHYYYTTSSAGGVMLAKKENDEMEMRDVKQQHDHATAQPTPKKHFKIVIGDVLEKLRPKHVTAPSGQRFKKKKILSGRTIRLRESTFTAVLGPTGCGKSVLLQAMSARLGAGLNNPPDSPQFYSAGSDPIGVQFDDGRDGYMPFVSVLEATMHGARLHFPKMSEDELEAHVMVHLTAFGLAPKAKDSAHKLSGGETKRLQVVIKLVTLPDILILDEPTSGLDSNAAEALLRHIASVAHHGIEGKPVTVVCSLKQPEPRNINNFDHFVFLDHDGDLVVEGDSRTCRDHFQIDDAHAHIWTDAAVLAIHGQSIHHLLPQGGMILPSPETSLENVKKHRDTNILEVVPHNESALEAKTLRNEHLSFNKAVCILAHRNFQQRWVRDFRATLGIFMMRYFLIPVIFSVVLWDVGSNDPTFRNRSALLFVFGGAHLFTTFISTAVIFPLERHIIEGEILSSQYSPLAYLAMQWLTFPLFEDAIGVLSNCLILKYCTSMDVSFEILFFSTFLMSQAGVGFGTIFGLFRSIVIASGLAVGCTLNMSFASGVLVSPDQMGRTIIFRGMETMSLTRMFFLICFRSELEENNAVEPFWSAYGFDSPSGWYDTDLAWAFLCGWFIVVRVSAAFLFHREFRLTLPLQK